VEKKELNTKMYAQLKTFMEEEKIINILDCENYIHEDAFPDFSAFQLKALLGKGDGFVLPASIGFGMSAIFIQPEGPAYVNISPLFVRP
jgi:hypothetical protein